MRILWLWGVLWLAPLWADSELPALEKPQLTPVSAHGLTFADSHQEVDAGPGDERVTVDFAFENTGTEKVMFTGLEVHCVCLNGGAVPKRMETEGVAPGEKGVIRTTFDLGQFRGRVEKTIGVRMNGENKASVVLTVAVNVPELVQVRPQTVVWELGGEPRTQTFDVKIVHTEPIRILQHSITSKRFAYEVETVREGWEYRVTVTPNEVERPGVAIITFRTDAKIAKHRNRQAFLVVRKPMKKEGE